MAPAQALMEIKLERESNYTTESEANKESKSISGNSDEKDLKALENSLLSRQLETSEGLEEEVDIINPNTGQTRLTKADDPDATEYSSSFGNTDSDSERWSGLSEAEVESNYFGDGGFGSTYDEFSGMFHTRKKRLTNHWRKFIRPLMWRCKWAELRIKEFESQAAKYARELATYDQNKHLGINQSMVECLGSKSLPFSNQLYRIKSMKRRKRKRAEDTNDIASYMSHHNLFSYLESNKTNADAPSTADDFGNTANMDQKADGKKIGWNDDMLSFDMRGGDNTLEQVLRKIEVVYSRVQKLRTQVDDVVSKHAAKFFSFENLSLLVPFDAPTSSAPSPTFSAGNAETASVGAIYNPTQHITEYDIGDLVLPDSAISSYGEAIHIPDIIESTVGLLSAADVTFRRSEIGDSCENILDNILIQNDGAEGEKQNFLGASNLSMEKTHEPEKGEEGESSNPSTIPASESVPGAKSSLCQEQSTLRSCLASDINFPKNKRKRGERRAGPGSWSKKGSGEADSQ